MTLKPENTTLSNHTPPAYWYKINNSLKNESEIYIYDEIGDYGITANKFIKDLNQLTDNQIRIRINSRGGDVFEALAIMNALKHHPARISVTIDGIAASAASFLAMAGDHITIAESAQIMIHEAWTVVYGDAKQMHAMAENLDKTSHQIATLYATRAGNTPEHWRELMKNETWFTAQEAVNAGLADELTPQTPQRSQAIDRVAYSGGSICLSNERKVPVMGLIEKLKHRLGLSSEADDTAVFEAVDTALTATETDTETDTVQEQTADEPETAPGCGRLRECGLENPPTVQAQADTIVLPVAEYEALKQQADSATQLQDRVAHQRRNSLVDTAIKDGRIPPAARDKWLKQLNVDETAASELLELLPRNSVPVKEIGHSDTVINDSELLYSRVWGNPDEKKDDK